MRSDKNNKIVTPSRREFIAKCGAGLAGIIAAGKAPAAIVKSLVGANGSKYVEEGKTCYTAKDYVQDNLVALWDGIENAGWGVHDASAREWVDLSGNKNNLIIQSGAHFDTNSLITADRNHLSAYLIGRGKLPYLTIEVCGFCDASRNSSALVSYGNSTNKDILMTCHTNFMQIYNGSYVLNFYKPVSAKSTWCGTHSSQNHLFYVNGDTAIGTLTSSNWSFRDSDFGLSGSSVSASYNFVGNYYCVRLYSRALTADEVASNYAVDKERFGLE